MDITHRHFESAAETIGKEYARDPLARGLLMGFAIEFFSEFNPRFDADRFRARVEQYARQASPIHSTGD